MRTGRRQRLRGVRLVAVTIEFQLQSSDVLVFMTDGIIEAKDNSGTEYQDTDRQKQVIAQFTADTSAEAMVSALIDDATTFGRI